MGRAFIHTPTRRIEKNHDLKNNNLNLIFSPLNQIFFIWYIDIYIFYIYKLFQSCSIQIDLDTCLNRGYMIFAYIKTLDNVHKASPPVVAYVLERKACCVSVAVAVIIIVC